MKPKSKGFLAFITVCMLFTFSCNLLQILSPTDGSDGTPEPPPTNFVIPTTVPSPEPSKPCPVQVSSPPPTIGPESFDIVGAITNYLNAGGNRDELENSIEELALLIQETPTVIEADFDGNGFNDLIISILLPSDEVFPLSGKSLFYLCHEDTFDLMYATPQEAQAGIPRFYSIEDLTGDGLTDVILGIENCGAHTCFTSIEGLLWTGESLENRLQGTSEDLPSPVIEITTEPVEIIVTGEGVASVGAGPNRKLERHWMWDEDLQSFIPTEDVLLPSAYRIHVLHDGDKALLEGEIETAIEAYSLVREDEALLDWVDPAYERANLGALTGFKLILAHILAQDMISAEFELVDLQESYPEGVIGEAFRQMAETFWAAYLNSNDLTSSCQIAQQFVSENSEAVLESLYFGYANPVYTAEDLCPTSLGIP